jgi:hypothetical protein
MAGGGHGPHTPSYGMASDQGLSFDIVLASGLYVTANVNQYSDLFWAVLGGGGSTFGVVISHTVKTFPDANYAGATVTFAGQDQATFWAGVGSFHKYASSFADAGLYAYYEVSNLGERLFSLAPLFGHNITSAQLNVTIQPFIQELTAAGISFDFELSDHVGFWDAYNALFAPEGVGYGFIFGSRMFSKTDMTTNNATAVNAALEFVVETGGYVIVSHIVAPGVAGNTYNNSVQSRWRENVLFPIISTFADQTMPYATLQQMLYDNTNTYVAELRAVNPGWGTYLNEVRI